MQNKTKILITTGVYPPKIGGPAQYAKNLKEEFQKKGYGVTIRTFNIENYIPTGIRHIYFFFKIIPSVIGAKMIFALDTYGVGFPTVFASKMFGKKSVIRTGGDFLWEQYVERTNKKVLLKDFYSQEIKNFSFKEQIIFKVTKWTLQNTTHIIFSTDWQREIFINAYNLNREKTSIVENYYGPKEDSLEPSKKIFIASTRELKWKNIDILKMVFNKIKIHNVDIELFTANLPFADFMNKIKNCYAVVLVSLGDISPNLILDAIRFNKPFICTKEVGIISRIKDAGLFVDPLNEAEIEDAILKLLNNEEYKKAEDRVRQFNYIHTWENIADEFIRTVDTLKTLKTL